MVYNIEKLKRSLQPLINVYHLIRSVAANVIYGFPSRRLKVIGVTGTDGKTTTSHLIYHILKSTGHKVALISSVSARIGDEEMETGLHRTTPDAFEMQPIIKRIADSGFNYLVLETTSHALDQNRVYGIKYEVGVSTNVTPEHLDYHKTYANLLRTKAKLLLRAKTSIINKDDGSFAELSEYLKSKNKSFLTYSIKTQADFSVDFNKSYKLHVTSFNNYNYLAAYSVCTQLGIEKDKIIDSLKSFSLPEGRVEKVYDKGPIIYVDFAHTPNSFRNVLPELKKELKKEGLLIHVFGSAGLRDEKKRPDMGSASAEFADIVILTEEDYRTEDPEKICREVAAGLEKQGFKKQVDSLFRNKKTYIVNTHRSEAIKMALLIAKKNDLVVYTGKSHERSLARGTKEYPWHEKTEILKALNSK